MYSVASFVGAIESPKVVTQPQQRIPTVADNGSSEPNHGDKWTRLRACPVFGVTVDLATHIYVYIFKNAKASHVPYPRQV